MAGRLTYFIEQWKSFTQDPFVLQCVQGYKIPFVSKPKQIFIPKNKVASQIEIYAIESEIARLLSFGAISLSKPERDQFVSPIFLVPKPDGKFRFILNLKQLNKSVRCPKFKMEDYRTAQRLVSPGCYFTKLDLKDAYFLIPIDTSHRKFLKFAWNSQLYNFNCLPFGLNTGPRVFTKLLKPILARFRKQGFLIVCYIDDLLILGNSKQSTLNATQVILETFVELGFIINNQKSVLEPVQDILFLGFIFNSLRMSIRLPFDKVTNILSLCDRIMRVEHIKLREFAKFCGVLNSACPAVPYSRSHVKIFEREKFCALRANNDSYNVTIPISKLIKDEVTWWLENLQNSENQIMTDLFDHEIFTDSSLSGWGITCNGEKMHGFWSYREQSHSINYLELKAAYYALRYFAKDWSKCNLLMRIDNTTAISYINRMGGVRHPRYIALARKFWDFCESKRIIVFASYIKSKDNTIADTESRATDSESEWELHQRYFNRLSEIFGTPEMDLFASVDNKKCEIYASWRLDPFSYRVDAFTFSWKSINFYAFPPFSLVLRCLKKIKTDQAEGILIVPWWPNQPWFPLFRQMCTSDPIMFGPSDDLLLLSNRIHPMSRTLILAASKVSGHQ